LYWEKHYNVAKPSPRTKSRHEKRSSVAQTSPQIVAEGRKLFLDSCAHCHAADATGDEGPDLHGLEVSDRYIHNLIVKGRPHEMPSFRKKLDDAKISEIIAYLHTLKGEG
jgi:mono/diheme cytochrome c family protein